MFYTMPMKPEDYEGLMNELNSSELAIDRKTEILQSLRQDYSTVTNDHEKFSKQLDSLSKEREQLLVTNSKLFRTSSYFSQDDEFKKNDEKKTFSETIKLSDIEKKVGQ